MNNGFRSAIASNGSMHLENQVGSLRYNLGNGSVDHILASSGNLTSVIKGDGSVDLEHTIGNMRFTLGNMRFTLGNMRFTLGKQGFEQLL